VPPFSLERSLARKSLLAATKNPWNPKSNPNVALNDFFKSPVPEGIKSKVELKKDVAKETVGDVMAMLTAPPGSPGVPRPLWLGT